MKAAIQDSGLTESGDIVFFSLQRSGRYALQSNCLKNMSRQHFPLQFPLLNTHFWQFPWELPPARASLVMTNLFHLGIHYDQNDHSEPSTVSRRKATFSQMWEATEKISCGPNIRPDCLCTRPTRQSYPQQLLTETYSLVTDRDFTLSVITGWRFWAQADPDKYESLRSSRDKSKESLCFPSPFWAGRLSQ